MSPWNSYIISFEIDKPNPMPPVFILFEWWSLPKNLKSFDYSIGFIPNPVSITLVTSLVSLNSSFTVILPLKVNLIAFPIRLKRICLYLFSSSLIIWGTESSTKMLNSRFFYLTWNSIISTTSWTIFLTLKRS